jgi:hypothetical protein
MGYDATVLSEREPAPYIYETVETVVPVRAALELIHGTTQAGLVMIALAYEPETHLAAARQSDGHLLHNLRPLVRKTDLVFLLNHRMYFVLRGANAAGAQVVQARLWETLLCRVHDLQESNMACPRNATIGHAGCEEAGIEGCIEAARAISLRYEWPVEKQTRKPGHLLQHMAPAKSDKTVGEEIDAGLPILARKLGVPYLTFLPREMPTSLQRLVHPRLAQELHCFPIGRERNTLTVAMLDPQDRGALERLEQETGLHIFPVLANPQALQHALEQLL